MIKENRRKGIIYLIIIVVVLAITLVGGYSIYRVNENYLNIIESNWGVQLPINAEEIYVSDSGASFLGDGRRYHVYQYEDNGDARNCLSWTSDKDVFLEKKIRDILKELDVAKENYPDFQLEYKRYSEYDNDKSQMDILYFEELNKMYVIEDIM